MSGLNPDIYRPLLSDNVFILPSLPTPPALTLELRDALRCLSIMVASQEQASLAVLLPLSPTRIHSLGCLFYHVGHSSQRVDPNRRCCSL